MEENCSVKQKDYSLPTGAKTALARTCQLNTILSLSSPVRLYRYSAHKYFSIKLTNIVVI